MYTQSLFVLMTAFVMTSSAQTEPTTTMDTEIMTSLVFDNGTTIEMTTATTPTMPSTTLPGPTPCAAADWIVRDSNRAVCMLMSFNGYITFIDKYEIPNDTSTTGSTCSEKAAFFSLDFVQSGARFYIGLNFSIEGKNYALSGVNILHIGGGSITSDSVQFKMFSVPLGKHYKCAEFSINVAPFELVLSSPVLQPFVLATKDQCGLGEPCECGNCGGSSSTNTGLIVGCVIAGLVVSAAVGYVIWRSMKKNSYNQMP